MRNSVPNAPRTNALKRGRELAGFQLTLHARLCRGGGEGKMSGVTYLNHDRHRLKKKECELASRISRQRRKRKEEGREVKEKILSSPGKK